MQSRIATTLYVLLMVAVIVAIDVAFFRGRLRERLVANVAIVLLFAVIYFGFLERR